MNRTFEAEAINQIVNDPDVYPWVHGATVGPLDVTPLVKNPANVCVWGEHGGVIFLWQQPGIYEMHAQCLKAGRGPWMLEATHKAFHYLFTHTDAVEVVTRVPKGNLAAKTYARTIGFDFEFNRPTGWVFDHRPVPVGVYSKTIQNWMRSAPGLEKLGEEFHETLHKEYAAMGKLDGIHAPDANHDRYVGAAVEMMKGGQPFKAVIFYNRWARLAGYQEISILKSDPVIIDISESILMLKDNRLRVVACQLHSQ